MNLCHCCYVANMWGQPAPGRTLWLRPMDSTVPGYCLLFWNTHGRGVDPYLLFGGRWDRTNSYTFNQISQHLETLTYIYGLNSQFKAEGKQGKGDKDTPPACIELSAISTEDCSLGKIVCRHNALTPNHILAKLFTMLALKTWHIVWLRWQATLL